ncbi:MAG: NAD(P)H-hydrate epimerase [Candidatus Margulisiibacteriota bacterium]|nr:NAD(P)H-hydrate epimerase [Candidatus Margulisiibacteriota bacterium]
MQLKRHQKLSFSVKQAKAFDKYAREKLGIPSIILMENAGRDVAEEALRMLGKKKRVTVVCGVGNNGGDGFVAARHLINAGIKVSILIVGKLSKLKPGPKTNYNILKKMKAKFTKKIDGDLIIDALFGIGLNSSIREPYIRVIRAINNSGIRVLAVDVPSGLDADTGKPLEIAVRARKTVTFVAPKKGFSRAGKYCGKIVTKDIGITTRK